MASNGVVRARIDEHTKEEAEVVLSAIGLTVSDAFRLLLTRVAQEKALPFELYRPNETTIAAMREARRGGLRAHKSVDDLMADLNAHDYESEFKKTVLDVSPESRYPGLLGDE